ncbi:hypothetical protein [Tessaracoccus oleiagri]|uniref:hypothetical protein n=1 Tax=Tessaracoccus oleiagri TaxID=686624 RepID=UPI00115FACAB|nr:hypothetical protein [Tessaracoccus oleiagri]
MNQAFAETVPFDPDANKPGYWEDYFEDRGYVDVTCTKDDTERESFTVGAPPDGSFWVGVILKAGADDSANDVYVEPSEGDVLEHASGKDISHVIACYAAEVEESPTPTPSITPTPSESPTPSVTPSVSESPTPSVTPSVSESPTPSETPSVSESPTPSVTPSVSESPTPSVTPSVSESPTPSVTPTVLPTVVERPTTPGVTPTRRPVVHLPQTGD